MDGTLFFAATDPAHGTELWRSDGTADGTVLVQDINPGPASSAPANLLAAGNTLYMSADDGVHGPEAMVLDLSATISSAVFNDLNHNGVRDAGEPGLAGVTVYVDMNNNGTTDAGEPTTITAADGTYVFTGVAPGTYRLAQVAPAGYRLTAPLLAGQTLRVAPASDAGAPAFGDVQVSTVPMDFGYLLTLAQHYGQAGTFATGDVTDDGTVNFSDLLLLAQNYGHALGATTGANALATPLASDALLRARRKRA